MHTALNETIAALPNDTKVYVSTPFAALRRSLLIGKAWSRIHEAERQILGHYPGYRAC